jgi:hypothetical protein
MTQISIDSKSWIWILKNHSWSTTMQKSLNLVCVAKLCFILFYMIIFEFLGFAVETFER